MRSLVDQLLDLSRLDAETVRSTRCPSRYAPRSSSSSPPRLRDATTRSSPHPRDARDGDRPHRLRPGRLEPAHERTPAGSAPVVVSAAQSDNHFRLAVEDAAGACRSSSSTTSSSASARSDEAARAVRVGPRPLDRALVARAHGGASCTRRPDPTALASSRVPLKQSAAEVKLVATRGRRGRALGSCAVKRGRRRDLLSGLAPTR